MRRTCMLCEGQIANGELCIPCWTYLRARMASQGRPGEVIETYVRKARDRRAAALRDLSDQLQEVCAAILQHGRWLILRGRARIGGAERALRRLCEVRK